MSSAELGMMMPHAGGDYVFLRRMYGLPWGFLYGYLSFFISFSGAIAVAATGVVQFQISALLGYWIDFDHNLISFELQALNMGLFETGVWHYAFKIQHLFAIGLVLLLTTLNYFGIKASSVIQSTITIIPIAFFAIAGLIIVILALLGSGETSYLLYQNFEKASTGSTDITTFARALLPVFFTYTGWNAALYLAEDVKRPHRVLPISMIVSLLIVSSMYLLFNLVLLASNPFEELSGANYNFIDANKRAWGILIGDWAGDFLNVVIVLLILAGLNTTILAGSRMYLAMARDGIFPAQAAKLHSRHNTPYISLWAQAGITCLIIFVFLDFDKILSVTTMTMIFLSMLTISTVFILRRHTSEEYTTIREANKKLFRVLGYPWMPLLYIGLSLFILFGAIFGSDVGAGQAIIGGALIAIGYIVYVIFGYVKRRSRK
ncbi:MAG: APC family permease, partial [Leptospiraceae bacterium]|nr:APC family permease [Leptospiraceae bacterium]